MDTRQRGGIEVNLKDMFFHILYHWRIILIVVIIGTLGMGYYQYNSIKVVHDRGEKTAQEKQYDADVIAWEGSVATSEQAVRNYTRLIAARKEYRDGSLLYKLNPTEVWNAVRVWFVRLDKTIDQTNYASMTVDPSDFVLTVYAGALDTLVEDEKLLEAFGTDNAAYVREVASIGTDGGNNTVTITTIAPTREQAEQQLDYLSKRLEELVPRAQQVYPHKLETVRNNTFTSTRTDLNTATTNIASEIESLNNSLNNSRMNAARPAPTMPSNGVKRMAVFGFLISFAVMLVFFGLQYAVSGRVHESRDLTARYGLPVYAEYVHSRAWNHHPGKLLDKLLEFWEFHRKMRNNDTVNDTLAALVKEQVPSGQVLFTGSLPTEKLTALGKAIGQRVTDGPEILVRGNLANDSETLTQAGQVDGVIIVEEMHVSRVKDVDRVAELLSIGDAKAIGFVTI